MTPEVMARCHARAFAGQGRGWTAAEFTALLDSGHVFAVGDDRAFALGRVVADEAEVLTIATDPGHRRAGMGRAVLAALEGKAKARGALRVFLEVAADNSAALGLYTGAGYGEVSRRKAYYMRSDGHRVDALILEKRV